VLTACIPFVCSEPITVWIFSRARMEATTQAVLDTALLYSRPLLLSDRHFSELTKIVQLRPTMRVLEIGCGTLHLGMWIIPFLDIGGYTCIEPEGWLTQSSIEMRAQLKGLVQSRNATILSIDPMSALDAVDAESFDVLIMSQYLWHAPKYFLGMLMYTSTQLLKSDGRAFISLLFSMDDRECTTWERSCVAQFSPCSVEAAAAEVGMRVEPVSQLKPLFECCLN
jgi:SAM-dependent methyltransferase